MIKIAPCPFCGGEASFAIVSATRYAIRCKACGATGTVFQIPGYTNKADWLLRIKAKAVKQWNERKGETA